MYSEKAETARNGLRDDLSKWRKRMSEFMPLVDASHISTPDVDRDTPEVSVLGLPSDLERRVHTRLEINELAEMELKIWQGVAYNILATLKDQIKYRTAFTIVKADYVRGTNANTRSAASLNVIRNHITRTANLYNFVRSRMLRVGLSADSVSFQHIGQGDLWMHGTTTSRTRSTTKTRKKTVPEKEEPWYWTVEMPPNLSTEERKAWSVESEYIIIALMHTLIHNRAVDRVRWHRQRAERDRHTEEVQILQEELRRVIRTHQKFADLWRSRVLKAPMNRVDNGRNAYALRTAAMHDKLRDRAEKLFRAAIKPQTGMKMKSVEETDEGKEGTKDES